ncbi:MAG: type II toxin-antitoxin system Phd/YefM family antitoxin [Proteobacteria bacterium]|nr:type II toxin-antitoxin system Phd/YefM family antitoxin [Pseudomonadota bacterium]
MQRIKLDQDIKPLSEFRANATACLQQVHDTGRPLIITQHGKSSAVLLDVQEYEQLVEELELLQEVKLAESQLDQNQGIPNSSAKQKIMERLKQ